MTWLLHTFGKWFWILCWKEELCLLTHSTNIYLTPSMCWALQWTKAGIIRLSLTELPEFLNYPGWNMGGGDGLSPAFSPAPLWNLSCPQVPLISFKTLSFLSLFTWVTQNSHLTCLLSSRLIVFKPSSSLLQSTNLTMPLSYLIVHLVSVNTRRKLILHSVASLALPYVTTACCPIAFPALPSTNFSCPQHLWFLKDRHIFLRAWTLHPPFC